MTNAFTKKDYLKYKNASFELFEFYPDPKQPSGFKRGTHTMGASIDAVLRASLRSSSQGGFILTCTHRVMHRAKEIDPKRNKAGNSATFWDWDYQPIADLIAEAGKEIRSEIGYLGVIGV